MKKQIEELNAQIVEKKAAYDALLLTLPNGLGEEPGQRSAKMEDGRVTAWAEISAMHKRKQGLQKAHEDSLEHRAVTAEMNSNQAPSGAGFRESVQSSGFEVEDKPIYEGPQSFALACRDIAFREIGQGDGMKFAKRNIEKYANRALNKAKAMSRAAGSPTYQESVFEDGGIWMETVTTDKMIDHGFNNSVVLKNTDRRTMTGQQNKLSVRGVEEKSRKDGARAGIRWYTEHELDELVASTTKYGKIDIEAVKMMAGTYASNEILADVGMMTGEINRLVTTELSFTLQVHGVEGKGGNDPMIGIAAAQNPALIVVPKFGTQAAGTVVFQNILDMKQRAWLQGLTKLEWYYNRNLEKQFRTMFVPTGDSGVIPEKMWEPAKDGKSAYLDGIPAWPIEQCEVPGDQGDLILNCPSEYLTVVKGGVDAQSSIHVQFLRDQTTFRFTIRVGGMPLWKSPLTPYKGDITTSPVQVLAVRA